MSKNNFQRPRGTYDILPKDYPLWDFVESTFSSVVASAGFSRISTPAFEDEKLFIRSVGETSEIISKEIYDFADKSGNKLALRPEGTAPVVRAYIENGLASAPKPVKLYLIEPMWRYDRPQAGRFRQFIQAGVEVFGSAEPIVDAQVIALAARFYRQLGIKFNLQINSLGDEKTRATFTKELVKYVNTHAKKLPDLTKTQLKTNPLRLLDSKEASVQKILEQGPQIIDFLDKKSSDNLSAVLEFLDNFEIDYELNPRLVRGLDYYSGVLFEFWGSHQGAQNAIGGGGRYDNLVAQLGSKPTSAVGFGLGLERLMEEMKKGGHETIKIPKNAYLVSIGDEAKAQAFLIEQKLLDSGISTVCELTRKNLTDQLARASKLNVDYAVIIGKKELIDQTVILKDLKSGNQETIPVAKIAAELKRRFSLR